MRELVAAILIVALAGCIRNPEPRNLDAKLTRTLPDMSFGPRPSDDDRNLLAQRYDFEAWIQAQQKLPEHAIVMTMSGGGTRAAALASAVVLELAKYHRIGGGPADTLASNIILISAASGGTMAASQFVLRGVAGLRDPTYDQGVLLASLRHVMEFGSVLNPPAWPDRARPFEGFLEKSFLSKEDPDGTRSPFTFHDLIGDPTRPFLILNTTDIVTGNSVPFTQQRMSDLCTDLYRMKLSSAVTAASNFPFASTDIELKNFRADGNCQNDPSADIPDARTNPYNDLVALVESRYRHAMTDVGTAAEDRDTSIRWLHLYDGGLADNLGLRPVLRLLNHNMLVELRERGVHDITLIEVNARSDPPDPLNDSSGSPYFVYDLLTKTSYGPIDRVTALDGAMVSQYLGRIYRDWSNDVKSDRTALLGDPPDKLYPVVVDFDQLADASPDETALRKEVKAITTDEQLTPELLAVVQKVGRTLLERNPCFQNMVQASGVGAFAFASDKARGERPTADLKQCRYFAKDKYVQAGTLPTFEER